MEPARSPGGTRRYRGAEVDHLRDISAPVDAGINIAGHASDTDLEKTVRKLQAKLSGFEALEVEMRRLEAEIASLSEGPEDTQTASEPINLSRTFLFLAHGRWSQGSAKRTAKPEPRAPIEDEGGSMPAAKPSRP